MRTSRIGRVMAMGILLFAALPKQTVYAGNLNKNEQSLLSYISGTLEYEGKKYQPTSEAMVAAKAKLMQDDIDLTDEQLNKAYAMIPMYMKTAIDSGYMVEVNSATEGVQETSPNEPSKETEEQLDKETEKEAETEVTIGNETYYAEQSDLASLKKGEAAENSIIKENHLEGTVTAEKGEEILLSGTLPVKNTGYNIRNGLLVKAMLGIVFVIVSSLGIHSIVLARKENE